MCGEGEGQGEGSWSPGSIECARNYQDTTDFSFHIAADNLVSLTPFLP